MDKLLAYLNGLPPDDQKAFAARCNSTVGYLRKACSVGQQLGEMLCLRIGIESAGAIKPEDLAPNVDWQYLRGALIKWPELAQVPASPQQSATEPVAPHVPTAALDISVSDQERREPDVRRDHTRRDAERCDEVRRHGA